MIEGVGGAGRRREREAGLENVDILRDQLGAAFRSYEFETVISVKTLRRYCCGVSPRCVLKI